MSPLYPPPPSPRRDLLAALARARAGCARAAPAPEAAAAETAAVAAAWAALPPADEADLVRSLTDAKRHAGTAGSRADTLKLLAALLSPLCPASATTVRTPSLRAALADAAGRAFRDADARVRRGAAELAAALAAAGARCGCEDAGDAVLHACLTGLKGRGGAEQAAAAHALRRAAAHLPPPPRGVWGELVGLLTDARFVARARLLAAFGTPGGAGPGGCTPARGLLLAHPPPHPRRAAALLGVAPSRAGPATGLIAASLSVEPAARRAGARCAAALVVAAGAALAPAGECAHLEPVIRAVLTAAARDRVGAVRDAGVDGLARLDAAATATASVVDPTPDATAGGLVEAVASTSGGGGNGECELVCAPAAASSRRAALDAASAAGTPAAPPPPAGWLVSGGGGATMSPPPHPPPSPPSPPQVGTDAAPPAPPSSLPRSARSPARRSPAAWWRRHKAAAPCACGEVRLMADARAAPAAATPTAAAATPAERAARSKAKATAARARASAAAAAFTAALAESSGDARFEAALRRELAAVNAQLAAILR